MLWHKFFRGTCKFKKSRKSNKNSAIETLNKRFLKAKYNPKKYKTKNMHWILIQKTFGELDSEIEDALLS
jgi:hypothetical protein